MSAFPPGRCQRCGVELRAPSYAFCSLGCYLHGPLVIRLPRKVRA